MDKRVVLTLDLQDAQAAERALRIGFVELGRYLPNLLQAQAGSNVAAHYDSMRADLQRIASVLETLHEHVEALEADRE